MRKILLTFGILIFSLFINGTVGVAETDDKCKTDMVERFKRRVYLEEMIKEIEFEAEVKIPKYVEIEYIEYMYDLAKEYEIPTRLTFRLVFKESSFIDTVKSSEGAHGFMQLMPETQELYSKRLNIDTLNLDSNCQNIYIGMNLLKNLHDYWVKKGNSSEYSWMLTLACYNAGIVSVIKYEGVPPYSETIKYIDFILRSHKDPELYSQRINKEKNDYTS